ncbi:MAG: hypothetical protein HZB76_02855, partial [Chlamydiae bacterium]|nr:hypothetical protein [Chlamydiota bacterium]
PEELSKAKPIYKCEHVWEEPTTHIVYHDLVNPNIVEIVTCYEHIDLAKCQEQAKQLEKMSNILCVAEILLNTGLVAKAIKKIAGLDAPLVIISVNYKAMATIPAHLHNDPVLRSIAICSLTQQPTRDPVREPRTGRIFEREAITSFINLNHTSPRNPAIPLRVEDLVDCPALKTLIENQLDALSTQANQAADRMRNGQHQE